VPDGEPGHVGQRVLRTGAHRPILAPHDRVNRPA
jgi:hypothetical protein